MVFFPSYRLMQDVYEVFAGKAADSCEILMQHTNMKEHEREAFWKNLKRAPGDTRCVLRDGRNFRGRN